MTKIHYTLATTMTITIRSKMIRPVHLGECGDPNSKPYTRAYQKQLHEAIAHQIMNCVEWARDDTDSFDADIIERTDIDTCGLDDAEISDYAEMNLEYKYGKTVWNGERIPTKQERNVGRQG